MEISLIPTPRRQNRMTGGTSVDRQTPVILQMPKEDPRLIRMAQKLFDGITVVQGPYALYSEGSFAPACPTDHSEGYLLWIRGKVLGLSAREAAGLFYGMQTLKQWLEAPEHPAMEVLDWPELKLRSDYLDMRGIFPKFENLLVYVEEMAHYKLNTLVVEYEDKMPRPRAEFCAGRGTLTPEQHRQLLETAWENFIDIIPLQQCFGHLEYALKLPQYQHLREDPACPGELCPLREGAFELAASLIEETAALHPHSRYLHLGCDEVWSLGRSRECRESGKSRSEIAVDYINRLAEKCLELGKIPVVWHDMFASERKNGAMVPSEDLSVLRKLNRNVVVALWLYSPSRVSSIAPAVIETLNSLGIEVLPCSAVRSADGSVYQNYPCVEQRLRNIDIWCDVIRKSRCMGMVNTNWWSTFSLGNPYGLFETSRYTAFYAAERCWNMEADGRDYLERFMAVYHGVYDAEIRTGEERRYDYYQLVGSFLPRITRNRNTARLVDLMYHLEHAVPANALTFRGRWFPDSEVEQTSLKDRAKKNYRALAPLEQSLRELLPELLEKEDAELFLESRCFENRMYRRELEDILQCSLTEN